MVDIVAGLQHKSLLSIKKFTDAKYITIFMWKMVNIYNGNKTTLTRTEEPIL